MLQRPLHPWKPIDAAIELILYILAENKLKGNKQKRIMYVNVGILDKAILLFTALFCKDCNLSPPGSVESGVGRTFGTWLYPYM